MSRSVLVLAALCATLPTATSLHAAVLHRPARALPLLRPHAQTAPAARVGRLVSTAELVAPGDDESKGLGAKIASALPPKKTLQKLVPLSLMFFSILFSYTILRDTKDVLVVTAPGSSAEAIPFLKTWVNLPGAILFTIVYSAMANRLGPQALFYATLGPFLAFFASFAFIIYPAKAYLHPNGAADWAASVLPLGFGPAISVVRNWTYSLFYFLANMWGSVVVSLLFWGFANEVTTIDEAKRYYPLFGMG